MKKLGSFSLKTLDAVRNLSKKDAELIQKVMTITLIDGPNKFICHDEKLTKKYGIYFEDVLDLINCNILSSVDVALTWDKVSNELKFHNKDYEAYISPPVKNFQIRIHIFTDVGREISEIIIYKPDNSFFKKFVKKIKKDYPEVYVNTSKIKGNMINQKTAKNYNIPVDYKG